MKLSPASAIIFTLSLLTFPNPTLASPKYMGSATCASSNCHGSVSPKKSSQVLQNEFTTWYKNDAHSQAYAVLKNQDSKNIAKHLGIGAPEKADLCLDCHSTNVPGNLRGAKFRLEEGVSCEGCHGPAEKYIQAHTARDATHSNNVSLGLKDLVSLTERASLCLECHLGTGSKTVDHRLIGAGHPRLTYELDTYGLLQPNHWEVDQDYVSRKAAYNSARAWLSGQVSRASEMVDVLSSEKRSKFGALPELGMFYCYNCHHSLKEDQWKSRSYGGRPGELKLNLSSLIMVIEGFRVIEPGLGEEIHKTLVALESAYRDGNATKPLQDLKAQLARGLSTVSKASFSEQVSKNLLKQIGKYAAQNPYLPYEVAEQCTMAISAITASIDASGNVYAKRVDALYNALKDEEAFQPEQFTKAAQAFASGG